MLNIIRDTKHLENKNAKAFVNAIKRECKKQSVEFKEIIVNEDTDIDVHEKYILIEPFEDVATRQYLKCWKSRYNTDDNITAKVVADICRSYLPQRILIINRSNLIGKPLFDMLIEMDHTVMMAHSKSALTQNDIENNDIIIFATGKNQEKFECVNKVVIDISSDYEKGKCGAYYGMSYIGRETVERIVKNAK